MNGEHKITSRHLERKALIYLRQSSMAQVRHHTESTRSQYALAGRAEEMGWARRDIEVIDTDLGISGKWGVAREGFTELVARLSPGRSGRSSASRSPAWPGRTPRWPGWRNSPRSPARC